MPEFPRIPEPDGRRDGGGVSLECTCHLAPYVCNTVDPVRAWSLCGLGDSVLLSNDDDDSYVPLSEISTPNLQNSLFTHSKLLVAVSTSQLLSHFNAGSIGVFNI